METLFLKLRLIYGANILVAGWVGTTCLFAPETAVRTVFSNAIAPSEGLRVVGALWSAIALLSVLGLFFPLQFTPVLLLQLVYKAGWLLVVVLPMLWSAHNSPVPWGMANFFAIWVAILPWIIPWQHLFRA